MKTLHGPGGPRVEKRMCTYQIQWKKRNKSLSPAQEGVASQPMNLTEKQFSLTGGSPKKGNCYQ
jgi:hypothetical protein